ncbi:MAG: hypothetical protein V7K67_07440 [Nostoc sp.]|uniref:hypothetical protein n=1 Tax=Nostoc sp. TaxID=1180 RepID=UPI002FF79F4F
MQWIQPLRALFSSKSCLREYPDLGKSKSKNSNYRQSHVSAFAAQPWRRGD